MDAAAAKTILEHFPYGLYVVTVRSDGEDHGMTANWITQASFDPPMIAVAIENTSKTIGLIRDSHHFAISLLTTEQREIAGKLGRTSEQAPQKLKGVKTKPAPTAQTPVLTEAVGWWNAAPSLRFPPAITLSCWAKSWRQASKTATRSR
jgi:flavin reductase (DIM6/NTAB) family NADH-FMN oxidoreductase RutF